MDCVLVGTFDGPAGRAQPVHPEVRPTDVRSVHPPPEGRVAPRLPSSSLPAFVGLGAFLWLVDPSGEAAHADAGPRIVVPADAIDALAARWTRQSGRPPDAEERRALVDGWVQEEVMVREARAMDLDLGDLVIRRRLIQKVDFLLDAVDAGPPPTDAELAAWLADHPDRYVRPERRSLTQVYVSRSRHGPATEAEAVQLLTQLHDQQPDSVSGWGDPGLRPARLHARTREQVARDFGPAFAAAVFSQADVGWSGPHASSFGLHLVRLDGIEPARSPELEEVRDQVAADWRESAQAAARAKVLAGWTAGYRVEDGTP